MTEDSKLLTALKTTVYKQLTQNVKSTDADSDYVARRHREMVDLFITEYLTPVLKENDKFELERLGNYFKVFTEGKMSQRANKMPFHPFQESQETLDKVVEYLETLEIEDYYNHSRDFIQGCFVIISNWYRNIMMNKRIDTVYNVLPPHKWYNAVVKIEQEEAKQTSLPENVQKIMNRIKVYGTLNF